MNIPVTCRECGTEFMSCPQIGVESIVHCPNGHRTSVRQANDEEVQALDALIKAMEDTIECARDAIEPKTVPIIRHDS